MTNSGDHAGAAYGLARRRRPGLSRRLAVLLLALVAGLGWAGWTFGPTTSRLLVTGASFGARIGCSCRYVGGRSLSDCHKDMEGAVRWVHLSEDPATRSVTASYPLLASQTATFREGWGCQLEHWPQGRRLD